MVQKIEVESLESHTGSETKAAALRALVERRLRKMSKDERAALYDVTVTYTHKRGLVIGGVAIPCISTPMFFDKNVIRHKTELLEKVFSSLLKLEEFAFNDQREGKKVLEAVMEGMLPVERAILLEARKRHKSTALRRHTRLDTFYNAETNEMAVIEVNAVTPEGLFLHQVNLEAAANFAQRLGIEQPVVSNSALHQLIRTLYDEYASRKNGRPKTIGVVFDNKGDTKVHHAEFPRIQELVAASSYGIEIVVGEPADVVLQNNKMYMNGKLIDVLWRNAINLEKAAKDAPDFIAIISRPDKFVVMNEETSRFMGNKITLNYIHDPEIQNRIGMTQSEIRAVTAIVPFSFQPSKHTILRMFGKEYSATEFLLKYRELFILKPAIGKHGHGVSFGANATGWKEAVQQAVDSGLYLAQRYVPYDMATTTVTTISESGELEEKEMIQDTNFHLMNGVAPGTTLTRACEKVGGELSVLNVAAGGGLRPSYAV